MPKHALAFLPLALLASSCTSSGTLGAGGGGKGSRLPDVATAAIEVSVDPVVQEIRVLEATRTDGDGRLAELLAESPDAAIRARAATALGRLPFPTFGSEVTGPLCLALADDDESVRAAAAFALDQRADPGGAGVLLASWRDDPSPLVRARIVSAAGRVHTPPIRSQVARAMQDPDLVVREAAVRATALWPNDVPDAGDTDSALLNVLSPYPDATGRRVEPEPELVWCALYSLARRRAEKGRGAFLEHVEAEDPKTRLFAVRGLSVIEPSEEGTAALIAAVEDPDWRVACEAAIGLGVSGSKAALEPLVAAVDHRSAHVRLRALEGLRNFPAESAEILPQVWRGRQDISSSVRAAALGTLARALEGSEAGRVLREAAEDDDPVVRAGAAQAAAEALDSFRAVPILSELANDPSLFVATRAIDGLGRHPTPRTRAILLEFLAHEDNGLRLAAVGALAREDNARGSDARAIATALATSTGDVGAEVAFNAARLLGSLAARDEEVPDDARVALVEALDHEDAFVRRVAREVLERDFRYPLAPATPRAARAVEAVALPGREFTAWTRNPVAEIVTSRGSMTFELLGAEAPLHVDNFLQRAAEDYYDGLTFHRVVPDFVVQGGDPRGDGNGGGAARGGSLPQEFAPRAYERGALGMPRNEDFDSGGSQIFVTHRATPHLDGRYTLFGLLRSGEEVLDVLEVGDVILDVLVAP